MNTISLELARELQSVCKEKNITMPEHYWGWFYQEITESNILLPMFSNSLSEYIAPAYTLDELLEWLPKSITEYFAYNKVVFEEFLTLVFVKERATKEKQWICGLGKNYSADNSSTNAACKLLIWLIKEGLYKELMK